MSRFRRFAAACLAAAVVVPLSAGTAGADSNHKKLHKAQAQAHRLDRRAQQQAGQVDRARQLLERLDAKANAALDRYQTAKQAADKAREILADAMYEVFRGVDDGTRAIREGIFRYWNAAESNRARSMALLSGHESRLPFFLGEYLKVVGMSTSTVLRGAVNDPSLTGRVRSIIGLGKKSFEKLGLVARGVREGNFAL